MVSQPLPVPLPAQQVLNRHETTTASDRDAAHAHVSQVFCDHGLEVLEGRGRLSMTLRSRHDGALGLDLLDYGATVRISPQAMEDFHLVQIPLAGRAEMTVGAQTFYSDSGTASVPPIERGYSMVWHRGTPQLILYVRREELVRVAGHVFGHESAGDLLLAPTLSLATPAGAAFLASVHAYHQDVNGGGAALENAYARRLVQESLLARLLLAVESNAGAGGESGANPESAAQPAPAASRLIRRFQELVQDHADEDLSVLDIAEVLGIPVRTLQHAVRKELDTTPTALLRAARLARSRSLLLAADPATASVTGIALQAGFSHLGRFAASYRDAFGETPSETLRR